MMHLYEWIKMIYWKDFLNILEHMISGKSGFKIHMDMHPLSMGKVRSPIRHCLISQNLFYRTQSTRRNFGAYNTAIPYGYPSDLRIGCVAMFLTSSGMD